MEWSNYNVLNDGLLPDADFTWTRSLRAPEHDGMLGECTPSLVPMVTSAGLTARQLGSSKLDANVRYIGKDPLSEDGSPTAPLAFMSNLRAVRQLIQSATLPFDSLNLFDRWQYGSACAQDQRFNPTSRIVPEGVTVNWSEPGERRVTLRLRFLAGF